MTSKELLSEMSMRILSRLLLLPRNREYSSSTLLFDMGTDIHTLCKEQFDDLVSIAGSNHVIVRALEIILALTRKTGDNLRYGWAQAALETEQSRIFKAVAFLHEICAAFEREQYEVTVIKSLDHLPDLGSDLDLYTNACATDVFRLMKASFQAQIAARSWGDRLARKWNFIIPELPEAVEIHIGRLGQTREQVAIAARLGGRSRELLLNGQTFRIASASDRLMISTLQRMYRHFYFRLCDIVDTTELVESGAVDYMDLRASAIDSGIWEGVATYLTIVSDYVMKYRGEPLDLPEFVIGASTFGGEDVSYSHEFLRVPIMPHSAKLYAKQLIGMLRKKQVRNGARLSLLPCLATAALVGQKFTGSDKGIW